MKTHADPLASFLERQGVVVLDGGLATELEARGQHLDDDLWSAGVLLDQPELIRQVHLDYLAAGADCIISSTYQATIAGFERRGLSEAEAVTLLRTSVDLALQARDEFWSKPTNRPGRLRPVVAASVGPYAAFRADGSEYTGDYDLDEDGLYRFHHRRWHILAATAADVMACETIPCSAEARALARLIPETPHVRAWISFACRDGEHLSDGSDLTAVLREVGSGDQVVAVGVNCTSPRWIANLIEMARSVTDKPIIVYPNSGETWDGQRKMWTGIASPIDFGQSSREWFAAGARGIGGCCRTGPTHIREIRRQLLKKLGRSPSSSAG